MRSPGGAMLIFDEVVTGFRLAPGGRADRPVRSQADIRRSEFGFGRSVHRHMTAAGIYRSPVKAYLSTARGESELEAYVGAFARGAA